jgi:hypothetical protein
VQVEDMAICTESCWIKGSRRERVRESNTGLNWPK